MADLEIVFRGLCSFVERDKSYEVFLLPGDDHEDQRAKHGASHIPTMIARIVDLELTHEKGEWKPDFVGYDQKGHQIGIWRLEGLAVGVRPGGRDMKKPYWPSSNRDDAIDFRILHEGKVAADRGTLTDAGASVVELVGGSIRTKRVRNRRLILKRGFEPARRPTRFADEIRWSGSNRVLNATPLPRKDGQAMHSPGGELTFVAGARVAVSNVAAVPNGLTHFSAYYTVFATAIAHDLRFTVTAEGGGGRLVKRSQILDVPVYDCVDPTPGPPDPSPLRAKKR